MQLGAGKLKFCRLTEMKRHLPVHSAIFKCQVVSGIFSITDWQLFFSSKEMRLLLLQGQSLFISSFHIRLTLLYHEAAYEFPVVCSTMLFHDHVQKSFEGC